jgi:hypothetical protein
MARVEEIQARSIDKYLILRKRLHHIIVISTISFYKEIEMGIRRTIMTSIAIWVAGLVVRRVMKRVGRRR